MPVSALAGLTPRQVEAILAHELAHIRRHDYVVNLLQTVVETLLFYHPAVWWLSHRIRVERENCCDDLAVSLCGDPVAYAAALAPATSLGERVARLAELRAAEGYMAEVSVESDGFLLVENHCPICAAAAACQGFCRAELQAFRDALGPGANVERTDHMLAGARRCAYRITAAA